MSSGVNRRETAYGFIYGAADVRRMFETTNGAVVIGIATPRRGVEVYITRTGMVRVFTGRDEWTPPKRAKSAAAIAKATTPARSGGEGE